MKRKILIAAVAATLSASAMAGNNMHHAIRSVEFTATPAPLTTGDMARAYTSSSAVVTYRDGSRKTYPLDYHTLYNSGDTIGNWQAGTIVDRYDNIMQYAVVDEAGTTARGPFYADSPDANSLLKKDGTIYLVTHFEYDTVAPNAANPAQEVDLYGKLPAVMNLASLWQSRSGTLSALGLYNISMKDVSGLWIPCAGELTPWNTHLGGEEYEPDARSYQDRPLAPMNLFLGTPGLSAAQGGARPYSYGLITEVTIDNRGQTDVVKHYAMGRLANELAHVMPDGRTVYKGDDGRDVVLTMFVADRRGDLSSGSLYAAKLEQLDGSNGGRFNTKWIRLGHASDNEVKSLADSGIRFSDIFDTASKADYLANPAQYADFRPVYSYTGTGGATSLEYLRVRAGMEKAAAFLETRRYAAYLGATTEFTKMEGQTSNTADRKFYVAMSYVERGMLEGQNGERPQDDIRLSGNPKDLACGIVYESNLAGKQYDTSGTAIHSNWVVADMRALLTGAQKPADQTAYGKYDKCDTDRMANPDNIKYSAAMRTLFVGEDSGNHFNNFLWAYSIDSGKMTRIASNRAGAEWTGLQAVDNMNGFAYIMSNIQHPGAEDDMGKYRASLTADGIDYDTFRAAIDQRGTVGYLGGLPAIHTDHEDEDGRKGE